MPRQYGGVQYVFRAPMYQQGYGLGGYFKRFFKWLVPIAEKHVLPHLKTGAQAIGREALDSVANIARDTARGRSLRDSAQEHVDTAIENIKHKAEKKLSGEGKRRKRRKIILKRRQKDIFD